MNRKQSNDQDGEQRNLSAKQIFNKYDTDKSGKISFNEFQGMMSDLGVNLSIPKQLEYFRLCDKDGSGQIDYEEFRTAMYVCGISDSNDVGFNPGKLLRPKDAFTMFDKDQSGKLDEDEFHFLLEYLGLKINFKSEEKLFHKYDNDKSGYIEYPEFKKIWLRYVNVKRELEERGVMVPQLATKAQMIKTLEDILTEEEEVEMSAVAEAKRWRDEQILLQHRRKFTTKAEKQAVLELSSALDVGGQVYIFGSGTLNQFSKGPRNDLSTKHFHHEGGELVQSLWASRLALAEKIESVTDTEDKVNGNEINDCVNPFYGLIVQQNSVWLWGRCIRGIAISDSVLFAHNKSEIFSSGGNDLWWHEIETTSHQQNHSRGEITTRSRSMLGNIQNHVSNKELPLSKVSTKNTKDINFESIKSVLQYYHLWSIPDKSVDQFQYAKDLVREKVDRIRLLQSLEIRGKPCKGLTKLEMIQILSDDLALEYRELGEADHHRLRQLEIEIFQLRRRKQNKQAKLLNIEFWKAWEHLSQIQKINAQKLEIEKASIGRERRIQLEKNHEAWIDHLTCATKNASSSDGNIALFGITPRGARPLTPTRSLDWKDIHAGSDHVGICNSQGQLYMWGMSSTGRLGIGDSSHHSGFQSPSQLLLPEGEEILNFSFGYSHSAVVTKNGNLYVFGSGSNGKLGLGTFTAHQECFCKIPSQLKFPFNRKILRVSCGSSHSACIDVEGKLYVWGASDGGKLGLGKNNLSDRFVPTVVESLTVERFVDVSCGNCQTLAITAVETVVSYLNESKVESTYGGKLYTTGSISALGKTYYSFFVYDKFIKGTEKVTPDPVVQISAGFSHQSAVTIDGELYTWGDNNGGCCGFPPTLRFLTYPTLVNCMYKKPDDLAFGRKCESSAPYGKQPYVDVDLGNLAIIYEIRLWNRTDDPTNPAMRRDNFTCRLFPCWIMVSQQPYLKNHSDEESLQQALQASIASKQFFENNQKTAWRLPRMTKGRFVRVQLDGTNLLEFSKVEVFGTFENTPHLGRINSAICGKRVTAVVIRALDDEVDIKSGYDRAVAADPYNGKILRQLDIYRNIDQNVRNVKEYRSCVLCVYGEKCPLCRLKFEFKDILSSLIDNTDELFLSDIVDELIIKKLNVK